MNIDKCYCHNITFSEILEEAKKHKADSLFDLQDKISVAEKCKLCKPYIQDCLKTGKTSYNKILPCN